jgi:hypothetical protein
MKVFKMTFVTIFAVLSIAGIGYSQTVLPVAADAGPDADLTAALIYVNTGAVADPVIELVTDGGVYTLNASDSVMFDLTIRAKDGLTAKPTIIPGDTLGCFLEIDESLLTSSITLKIQGVKFDGRFADGSLNPFGSKDFIAIVKGDEADRTVLPNLILEDCDFSYCYEKASPETDNVGNFIRVRDYGTAGIIRIENCTFSKNPDEAILLQKASGRDGVIRAADSLIIRNCTFMDCGQGPKCQGLITVKGDKDATTEDAVIVLENVTVYQSDQRIITTDDCENTVVRNILTASPDTTYAEKDNKIISIEKASSSISHIGAFDVAYAMDIPDSLDAWSYILENSFEITAGRNTGGDPGTVDVSTIYNFDPMFADAANGDFTLMEGSPAYGKAHDGGALGDLRWATNPTSVAGTLAAVPDKFSLLQNYPNPFNPTTTISYSLDKKSDVKLQIFDVTGGLVETLVNGRIQAGSHTVTWDASDIASGIYFYQIKASGQSTTRKMTLLK